MFRGELRIPEEVVYEADVRKRRPCIDWDEDCMGEDTPCARSLRVWPSASQRKILAAWKSVDGEVGVKFYA
jgi:hypothetical protein